MKIFPYEKFEIETSMPIDEVVETLHQNTEPPTLHSSFAGNKEFQGRISGSHFEIYRNLFEKSSFLHRIHGVMRESETGTVILVEIMPHWFVLLFMALWVSGVSIAAVVSMVNFFNNGEFMATPFVMLIAGTVLAAAIFWPEAKVQKNILMELFDTN